MRILFVDDEPMIRNSIQHVLDWKKIGCDKLDIAASYDQAVSFLEKSAYDLVISDIVMQRKMDGINLSKYIRVNFENTKVILLSAHEDFAMARGAIEAGVVQYLLKPIIPSELEKAIETVTYELKKSRKKQNELIELEKQVYLYKDVATDSVWRELIEPSGMNASQVDKMLHMFGLDLFHGNAACVLIRCTHISTEKVHLVSLNNLPTIIGHLFLPSHEYLMFVSSPCDLSSLRNLRTELAREGAKNLFVVRGDFVDSIYDLQISYKDAKWKLSLYSVLQAEALDLQQEYDMISTSQISEIEALLRDIKVSILYNGKKLSRKIDEYYSLILNQYNGTKGSLIEGKLLFMLSEMQSEQEHFSSFDELSSEYFSVGEIIERKQYVERFIQNNINRETITTNPKLLAQTAKRFIDDNFSDKELTVTSIADYFHINSAYFSRLFKKQFGITCIGYITQTRIEYAKSCLVNTEMKLSDISEKTGYTNVYYFSIQFKKTVGMTPGEFRKKRTE